MRSVKRGFTGYPRKVQIRRGEQEIDSFLARTTFGSIQHVETTNGTDQALETSISPTTTQLLSKTGSAPANVKLAKIDKTRPIVQLRIGKNVSLLGDGEFRLDYHFRYQTRDRMEVSQ